MDTKLQKTLEDLEDLAARGGELIDLSEFSLTAGVETHWDQVVLVATGQVAYLRGACCQVWIVEDHPAVGSLCLQLGFADRIFSKTEAQLILKEVKTRQILSVFSSPSDTKNNISSKRTSPSQEVLESTSDRPAKRSALFLDRDGVLIEDKGYVSRAEDVKLLPDFLEDMRQWKRQSSVLVQVSNQSGMARGYFGWKDLQAVQQEMTQQLAQQGVSLDLELIASSYLGSEDVTFRRYPQERKPRPGMFFRAAEKIPIDFENSKMMGDRALDGIAAYQAGIHQFELTPSLPAEKKQQERAKYEAAVSIIQRIVSGENPLKLLEHGL